MENPVLGDRILRKLFNEHRIVSSDELAVFFEIENTVVRTYLVKINNFNRSFLKLTIFPERCSAEINDRDRVISFIMNGGFTEHFEHKIVNSKSVFCNTILADNVVAILDQMREINDNLVKMLNK